MRIRKIHDKGSGVYVVVDNGNAKEPLAISYFDKVRYADKAIELLKETLTELGYAELTITNDTCY